MPRFIEWEGVVIQVERVTLVYKEQRADRAVVVVELLDKCDPRSFYFATPTGRDRAFDKLKALLLETPKA